MTTSKAIKVTISQRALFKQPQLDRFIVPTYFAASHSNHEISIKFQTQQKLLLLIKDSIILSISNVFILFFFFLVETWRKKMLTRVEKIELKKCRRNKIRLMAWKKMKAFKITSKVVKKTFKHF